MPALTPPSHESFAQSRASGIGLMDSFAAAGLVGQKATASRFNERPEIQARIAELQEDTAEQNIYDKTDAIRDLVAIIHARASDAAADNHLCEIRRGKNGTYHRFPSKLSAMARLIKLMGWNLPDPVNAKSFHRSSNWLFYFRSGLIPPELQFDYDVSPVFREGYPEFVKRFLAEADAKKAAEVAKAANEPPSLPSPSLNPRQEAFAQARFSGLGVMEAYRAVGYPGNTPNLASRLNSMPKIKARIAELNDEISADSGYHKHHAIQDLVTIIRACPSEASPDHLLCEMRMSPWGEYHRFPNKLIALTLLIRLLEADELSEASSDSDDSRS